ncbi:MAG: glycosyltransferase family 2 protein [Candidatus Thermoplasmatota archaeon]|jgi:glycosyltransferase involved in cell wall biosynthesis|nr:glycosyltransferase family 2 protein [Candidatus Thermoplasmatota archaeon]MCL5789202.1 glycosyltransferase family 2 protein [Candidatus Thermoplasmatota archaeon]
MPQKDELIDVVIPTLNSERTIEQCLKSIRSQTISDDLVVTIIDGGSRDNTIEIAKSYNCKIFLMPGMYGTGKNGARNYGEHITKSPFVWLIDSDNILKESTVAERLIEPLSSDPSLNISVPMTAKDDSASSFNNWISLREIDYVTRMLSSAYLFQNGYYFLNDIYHGLSNATLIRRKALMEVGGYDSDVRTLIRLRSMNLSKGVVDIKSHFFHNQVSSILEYLKKWNRRISKFSNFNESDLENYFVDGPYLKKGNEYYRNSITGPLIWQPILDLSKALFDGNTIYLWGVVYIILMLADLALHPVSFYKTHKNFQIK